MVGVWAEAAGGGGGGKEEDRRKRKRREPRWRAEAARATAPRMAKDTPGIILGVRAYYHLQNPPPISHKAQRESARRSQRLQIEPEKHTGISIQKDKKTAEKSPEETFRALERKRDVTKKEHETEMNLKRKPKWNEDGVKLEMEGTKKVSRGTGEFA